MIKQIIVVKLGTSVLTSGSDKLDRAHMVELVRQIAVLHKAGHRVVLVTSGAIAAGREHLAEKHAHISSTIANKQMLAAVGQSRLIQVWENLFSIYGLFVGQMLLTRADLEDRERFLNARDTLKSLLDHRIIPVVNENDAVATAEIKVGDNDNLSALVSILAEANKLVLLTDQPGLFTADPRNNPDAELIEEVQTIDDTLRSLAGDSVSGLGTGGMATKLQAADVARRAAIEVVVASGHAPQVLCRLAKGERVGTKFTALSSPLENRKRWIFAGPPPQGTLILDAGACNAVQRKGSSLLPKGVMQVTGEFKRGDVLRILTPERQEIARGICRYNTADMQKIKGQHSDQIDSILGYGYGSVVIHRDDMVLI
ncbi:glutamate 5-kinase [Alginatibacterium sediminis]|uniref:Glutamate 5-kinase n=1 Tax=Alginatibacterium sediminis TaxID=2164068 RepID=A0A420E8K3_9ALTE|nr:glutamate 5-kinase [Alginatibacterium sediminis]RKF15755.1 glutamate 5-kinase [Alginatibacterium sediminis]